ALDRLGLLSDASRLLIASLEDSDPEIRATAAANLGRVRRAEAWPPLVRAARCESSEEVLCQIAGALAGYRDPAIADVLWELLAHSDHEYLVRMEVVVQLWKYDPATVRPRLAEIVLGDDNDIVRAHAADSLELLDCVSPLDPGRQQRWLRLMDDDVPGIAAAAARALSRNDMPPVADVLELISIQLHDPIPEQRALALHRLSMLAPDTAASLAVPLLGDVQEDVRVACCACLGAIRDPAAVSPLVATLRSGPESRLRVAALLGLENYHAAAIGDALLELLDSGSLDGDALSILCRQLWKYPSEWTVDLLQQVLGSSVKLSHRPLIENTLEFLRRLSTTDPPSIS
ncbi:MAG TPA: HEAT repeat domain-containing protein, partial [Kofleriaceae bacterium]|nr:HEAT repeat domain-containing protein [Kofleriaceae bacterium]